MIILWPDGSSELISDMAAALVRVRKRYAGLPVDSISVVDGEIRVRGIVRGRITDAVLGEPSKQTSRRVDVLSPTPEAITLVWADGRQDAVADCEDALSIARQRYRYMRASSVVMVTDEVRVHGIRKARLARGLVEALALGSPTAIEGWQLSVAWTSGLVSPVPSTDELSRVIAAYVKEDAIVANNIVYSAGALRGRLRLSRAVILREARIAPPGNISGSRIVLVRAHTRRLPNNERY